ncbi:N-fatty-acyl-amino acid synthase/hydrolase PM20D1-like isoform X1 [Schistocerca cancellata]|uniref:N-fatty-acyl-amino acid synthase/hydrolase PM20D1-like isoform X1 n=2 Tax=Schistocerca cancellata TaxID=274614 RepID=UPI0021186FAB|nr:N-fatty-acyl-amino acid synthase/hydrolase PM20D1-like isoform X1 [Schistocerca cancellata]
MHQKFIMGSTNKRKLRLRYRCWQKIFLSVIGLPLAVTLFLSLVAFLRAVFIQPQQYVDILELLKDQASDAIERSSMKLRSERLAGALRIPTVSYAIDKQEKQAILQYHEFIKTNFPLIHSSPHIKREVINEYSLLYTVEGTSKGKLPYLLASHLDVVPADPRAWDVPPFSGKIVNQTFVYGRGAIDDKTGVMGILEALEYMLEKGQRTRRTFYIAFGHDEEISGRRGAQEIAKILTARGVTRLDFVLDEGYPLTKGLIPGTDRHVAIIGVSEKGSATVELSVRGSPGHSSFPPAESAIGILAAAVARLEKNPQPALLGQGPEAATFQYLAPHVSFGYKILYSNLWLFSGLMARELALKPIANAIVRTTTAITVFHGGIKENVVPPSATAVINHRVHPAQRVADVISYDREIIDDPRVHIRVKTSREAHPVSPFDRDCIPFQMVATSIKQVFHDSIVVPGVFIANTDTRWYLDLTANLYRFLPTIVTPADITRYHGNNERISIDSYHQAINFYYRIIKNSDLLINVVPASVISNEEKEL